MKKKKPYSIHSKRNATLKLLHELLIEICTAANVSLCLLIYFKEKFNVQEFSLSAGWESPWACPRADGI